jgi:hypothetical protein
MPEYPSSAARDIIGLNERHAQAGNLQNRVSREASS